MKVKDKQDLLARTALCLLTAVDKGISIPPATGNATGWYLMYSSGREKEWVAMSNRIIDFVSTALNDSVQAN